MLLQEQAGDKSLGQIKAIRFRSVADPRHAWRWYTDSREQAAMQLPVLPALLQSATQQVIPPALTATQALEEP